MDQGMDWDWTRTTQDARLNEVENVEDVKKIE